MRQFSYFLLALAVKSCAALPRQAIVDTAASSISAPETVAIYSEYVETYNSPMPADSETLSGNLQVDFEDSSYGDLELRDLVKRLTTRTSTITTSAQPTTSASSSSAGAAVSSTAAGSLSTTSAPTSTPAVVSDSSTVPASSAAVSQAPVASGTQAISSAVAGISSAPTAVPTVNPFIPSPPSPSLSRPPPQNNWLHIGIAIGVFSGVAICALSVFVYIRRRILKSIRDKQAAKFARDGLGGGRNYGAKGPTINVTDPEGEDKGAEMANLSRTGLHAGKGHVRARSSVSARPRKETTAVEQGPRLPPRHVQEYEVPSISWEGRRRMWKTQGLQIWDVAKTWPGQLGRKGGEASAKVAATVANGWPKRRDG